MQTFGWNLLQFARSVDHLNQDIVNGMKEVTTAYFLSKEGLGACYFAVHRTGAMFEGEQALKTVWSSEANSEAQVVRRFREKGSAESPSLRALAYNDDRCLWVTSVHGNADEGGDPTLDDADPQDITDLWREHSSKNAGAGELPRYISLHDKPCRTLVALPLKHHGEKLGVLVIEFDRRIPITSGAREEARLVQEALGRVLWLQDASKSQHEDTRKAFEQLRNIVTESRSTVDPPTVFFAFPGNSDPMVISAIKDKLQVDYRDQLKLISWDEMASPGQITDQVVNAVSHCKYGICYLSERAECETDEPVDQTFSDNANVLIEAGMLYALRHSRMSSTVAWIPVRESSEVSGTVPFDFVAERMIQVPRGEDGSVVAGEFSDKLQNGIDAMLSI